MFALLEALTRQITNPIYNVRIKLLANKASRLGWSSCHDKRLFNVLSFSSFEMIT